MSSHILGLRFSAPRGYGPRWLSMKADRRRRPGRKLSNGVQLQPGNAWLYGGGSSSGRTASYLKVVELTKSDSGYEKPLLLAQKNTPLVLTQKYDPEVARNISAFPWPELQKMVGRTFKTLGQVSNFTLSRIDRQSVHLVLSTGQSRTIMRASFEKAWNRIQAGKE